LLDAVIPARDRSPMLPAERHAADLAVGVAGAPLFGQREFMEPDSPAADGAVALAD
jgi:hypothetical protein